MTLDDPAGRTSSTHLVACHPERGGGFPTYSPCRSNSMRQMSQPISKRLHTPAADGSCLVSLFCVCLSFLMCVCMRVCVCVCAYTSLYVSVSLWSLRILMSGRKSVHIPIQALSLPLPTPPPSFRTASPERSQIADCRTCVRQSPFTSFLIALWDLPYTRKKTWCELPSVLPAQSHARTSSSLACILGHEVIFISNEK